MEQRQGSPENIEIKVVNPRRVDNVVHPACPTPARPRRKLSDYGPFKKWYSWLVPLFVAANVVLFVIVMFVNNCPKNSEQCIGRFLGRFAFQPFKENPLIGPSIATLKKMGALDVKRIVHGHQGWRLLSCMWLHAGVFHILANMLSLVFIGIRLEQEFGFVRIGLLYVLSGFGGSLLSALFQDNGISVGASGALFGLLGSMLSELIANWTMYANKFAALLTLLFIILVNLAVGLLPHVDSFAHIGGFVTGFLLGFVFLIRPQFKWISRSNATPGHVTTSVTSKHKKYQYALWIISLILFIVATTLGMISLLRGVNLNEHCSWCHYMNCIPSAKWKCQPHQFECLTSQHGNQLNLTCTNTWRTGTFTIPDISTYNIQQLCTELCD